MTTNAMTLEHRQELVCWLREAGHSQRAIAGLIGIGKSVVFSDLCRLRAFGVLDEPERTIGLDGKTRPARRAR